MERPLYLKLYLAFLGVLFAIAVIAAAAAMLLAHSFPLVRAGPRVALHLSRSLPTPDNLAQLQREVGQAGEELGLDIAVVGLDGKELAHAGPHIEPPSVEELQHLRMPAWVSPGLVSAPLRKQTQADAARAAEERKRAVEAEHPPVRLPALGGPPPSRFAPPPDGLGPARSWGDEPSWADPEPPLAIVLVRVPVPVNPTQVWGVRTLFILLGALVVAAALLYPLSRSITRPLEQLTHAAEAFGNGELSRRSGIAAADEVGRLARSFDEMAARIERARRAEKELLANVSHELRTPLARLTVALELIEPPPGPAGDSVRKRLAGLGEEITELNNLVADVLTQSRLELAELPLTRRRVVLPELLERCRERAMHLCNDPVRLEVQAGLAVQADEALLKRVLDNLIDNSRKYANGTDTAVTIRARSEGGDLMLSVSDRGPGFPPDDLTHVFDPFFRGQNAGGREGGYGLGLALAKRVAEAHGGTIVARNLEGGGAQVELRLPGVEG